MKEATVARKPAPVARASQEPDLFSLPARPFHTVAMPPSSGAPDLETLRRNAERFGHRLEAGPSAAAKGSAQNPDQTKQVHGSSLLPVLQPRSVRVSPTLRGPADILMLQQPMFGGTPDLRTAAHEAVHIVQQLVGIHLTGGIGRQGDAYERHANTVADAVVAGRSAEGPLEPFTAPSAMRKSTPVIQMMKFTVLHNDDEWKTSESEEDLKAFIQTKKAEGELARVKVVQEKVPEKQFAFMRNRIYVDEGKDAEAIRSILIRETCSADGVAQPLGDAYLSLLFANNELVPEKQLSKLGQMVLPDVAVGKELHDEVKRQLQMQVDGLNRMTIKDWATNFMINRMKTTEALVSGYTSKGGKRLKHRVDGLLSKDHNLAQMVLTTIRDRMISLSKELSTTANPLMAEVADAVSQKAADALAKDHPYMNFLAARGLESMQMLATFGKGGMGRQSGDGDEKWFRNRYPEGVLLAENDSPNVHAVLHNPDQVAGGSMQIFRDGAEEDHLDRAREDYLDSVKSVERAKNARSAEKNEVPYQLTQAMEKARASYVALISRHFGDSAANSRLGQMWVDMSGEKMPVEQLLDYALAVQRNKWDTTRMDVSVGVRLDESRDDKPLLKNSTTINRKAKQLNNAQRKDDIPLKGSLDKRLREFSRLNASLSEKRKDISDRLQKTKHLLASIDSEIQELRKKPNSDLKAKERHDLRILQEKENTAKKNRKKLAEELKRCDKGIVAKGQKSIEQAFFRKQIKMEHPSHNRSPQNSLQGFISLHKEPAEGMFDHVMNEDRSDKDEDYGGL